MGDGVSQVAQMITVQDLVKTHRSRSGTRSVAPAVDGVSFAVARGEFFTLLGPSGCGKTTSLRCLAGLERPESGTIKLDDTVVTSANVFVEANERDIGMVFQSYAVWPHMSVFENVAFPLRLGQRRRRGSALRDAVHQALELVGLGDYASRGATQLSGGEQQRVALARAIVSEPAVLLLDEPLSNLDAKLRERMRSEIRLLHRRLGITTVFVTHDQTEALSMSDRIAVMCNGRIVQEGTPRQIYFEAQNEFVASFIGSTNLIPGRLKDPGADGLPRFEAAFGIVVCGAQVVESNGSGIALAIRPEEVKVRANQPGLDTGSTENVFRGRILVDLFNGTHSDYTVELDTGHILRARASSRMQLAPDQPINVELPPEACRLLPFHLSE